MGLVWPCEPLGAPFGTLWEETIKQTTSSKKTVPELISSSNAMAGIKVDTGAKTLAGSPEEKITEGLDGLRERLKEYYALGARFTKWRAVYKISDKYPSVQSIKSNAHALARYAALVQEAKMVPIVEPEVLMDGPHDIEKCYRFVPSGFICFRLVVVSSWGRLPGSDDGSF